MLLAYDRGADRSRMDFIGEVKDDCGNTIRYMRDRVEIKLGKERIQELAKQPIQYDTGFTLLPGKYVIKFLARDAETGRIESSFVSSLRFAEKFCFLFRIKHFCAYVQKLTAESAWPLHNDLETLVAARGRARNL